LFEFIKASCLSLITDTKNKSLLQADKETAGKGIKQYSRKIRYTLNEKIHTEQPAISLTITDDKQSDQMINLHH